MLSNQEKETFKIIVDNLLDHVPGHIYWKNKDGFYLGCNKEQAEYFGFDNSSEVVGKSDGDLLDKKNAAKIREIDLQVMKSGKTQVVEEHVGSRWFLSKKMPLRGVTGEIIGIFGLSMEITAQKEKELSHAITADNLLAHMPGHIYWKNKEGVFLGCNEEHAKYFGLKNSSDIIGKTNSEVIVNKLDTVKTVDIDNHVMQTGETAVAEEQHCSRWFLSKKSPLKDFQGETIGVFGLSLEITEQKNLEAQLQQRAAELTEALEAKDRFIRNVSHEIRTPLQAITTIPEELLIQYDRLDDAAKKKYLGLVVSSNKKLMNIVSSLLDLSKFKEGKFLMTFKKSDIKLIAAAVINEFHYTHGPIPLTIDEGVPQTLVCDSERISQVLRNLITNSMRYGSREKPISVRLSMWEENEKQYVKCTVKDEGVGIPEEDKYRIFDAFGESKRTRSFKGGTGLGLAIAKEITEAHRGRIWVDDLKEGEIGARISFILSTKLAESVVKDS